MQCRAVTPPRRKTRWNLQGCPKLVNGPQPLVGPSSPYYEDVWRRYRCLTSFFPIVDTCLSCEEIARQSCGIVPRWRLFGDCLRAVFSARRAQHVSDLHSKLWLHYRVNNYNDTETTCWPLRWHRSKTTFALALYLYGTGLGLGLEDQWPWPWPWHCMFYLFCFLA